MSENGTTGSISNVDFESLKLRAGTWLQLQSTVGKGQKFDVEYAGTIRGKYIFFGIDDSSAKQFNFKVGDQYQVKGFNGVSDFTFNSEVLEIQELPFIHAYLAYPKSVKATVVRDAKRMKTSLPSTARLKDAGSAIAAVIKDISVDGALIESANPLGEVGTTVEISFSTKFEQNEVDLILSAVIRHHGKSNSANEYINGVEFVDISKDAKPILYYLLFKLSEQDS
jgi:c-di-GMP-binding flagellar brake protein YcgR